MKVIELAPIVGTYTGTNKNRDVRVVFSTISGDVEIVFPMHMDRSDVNLWLDKLAEQFFVADRHTMSPQKPFTISGEDD